MVAVVKQRNLGNKLQTAAAFLAPIAALALIVLVPGVFPAASPAAAQEPNASPTKDAGNKTTINTTVRQVLLDVVVTDGLIGNIVLKTCESMGRAIGVMLKTDLTQNPLRRFGAALALES